MSDIHILETDLDLKQNLNIYTTCKQLDTLHLKLNIYDDGLQATLTNYNVRLKAMKADKVPLIQDAGITINNNIVTIIGDEQLTTTSGNTLVELQFINKTTGEKKATFNLVLKVIATTLEVNRTISTATYTLLQELENKLDQASDFFENIDEAITSNTNLIATNNTANSTKKALDTSNTTALATKTALDTSNATANTTKKALDTSKTNADNSKSALDTSKVNADTSKVALDKSIVDSNKFVTEHSDVNNLITTVASHTTQLSDKVNKSSIVNNLSTNQEGFVLDARQGAVLLGLINNIFLGFPQVTGNNADNATSGLNTISGGGINNPFGFWCTLLTFNPQGEYKQQLAFPWATANVGTIKYRLKDQGTWTAWKTITLS